LRFDLDVFWEGALNVMEQEKPILEYSAEEKKIVSEFRFPREEPRLWEWGWFDWVAYAFCFVIAGCLIIGFLWSMVPHW